MLKIGHRGACGYKPENTLASFGEALRLHVDMVELDVHLSRDGHLMVIHDENLETTTNGHGKISDFTLEELKRLDAGSGERIPTLQEVYDLVWSRRVKINIELKGRGTGFAVSQFINDPAAPQGLADGDKFLISSFDHNELSRFIESYSWNWLVKTGVLFRQRYCAISLGRILTGIPFGLFKTAKKLGAFSVNLSYKWITPKLVQKAHALGFKIFVWTVNEAADIKRMKDWGVDGIFSDYPDRL